MIINIIFNNHLWWELHHVIETWRITSYNCQMRQRLLEKNIDFNDHDDKSIVAKNYICYENSVKLHAFFSNYYSPQSSHSFLIKLFNFFWTGISIYLTSIHGFEGLSNVWIFIWIFFGHFFFRLGLLFGHSTSFGNLVHVNLLVKDLVNSWFA